MARKGENTNETKLNSTESLFVYKKVFVYKVNRYRDI